jgi:hypothetical protein
MRIVVAALVLLLSLPRPAAAECDPAAAAARDARLRRELAHAAGVGRAWNWSWAGAFTGLAGLQLVAIARETSPGRPYDDAVEAGLYLGAGKATLAALTRVVTPLRAARPAPPTGDACRDLAAAERALALTARRQRLAFWTSHAGGLALTVGGLLALGLGFDSWREGLLSVATGYPVGLLHTYTMPRGAWKAHRRALAVSVERRGDFTGLALAGTF